jgi:hypothetical protein
LLPQKADSILLAEIFEKIVQLGIVHPSLKGFYLIIGEGIALSQRVKNHADE